MKLSEELKYIFAAKIIKNRNININNISYINIHNSQKDKLFNNHYFVDFDILTNTESYEYYMKFNGKVFMEKIDNIEYTVLVMFFIKDVVFKKKVSLNLNRVEKILSLI